MKMYRAVPIAGFQSQKVYGPQATRRMPSNVSFLADNVWEYLRPEHAPSRRHAVYASPTPELALQNASAVGVDPSMYIACELVTTGTGILLAHLQVTDARLHEDIGRIARLVAKKQGDGFADLPLAEKLAHAALYLPAVSKDDVASYLERTIRGLELREELSRHSTFWQDASYEPQPHNGEMFFQLPAGASYVLKPV